MTTLDHSAVADALDEIFREAATHPDPRTLLGRVASAIANAADREGDALSAYADARLAFVECLGPQKIKNTQKRQAVLAAINAIRSIESRREIFRGLREPRP